jgi:hypothetical protein
MVLDNPFTDTFDWVLTFEEPTQSDHCNWDLTFQHLKVIRIWLQETPAYLPESLGWGFGYVSSPALPVNTISSFPRSITRASRYAMLKPDIKLAFFERKLFELVAWNSGECFGVFSWSRESRELISSYLQAASMHRNCETPMPAKFCEAASTTEI